ncbi:MAG: Rrf2 family transcriptional regulator [Saprospiraceae bacterium]|nr:Rrf2 family transcriptional regulator [Saprospiraceae bacterium]MCB9345770.1 Rrf2 family transcriptional regulator [Lewinellaceae bacterium]
MIIILVGRLGRAYICIMFSKTFGHALRAVTYVAIYGRDGNKVSLQTLSKSLHIPHPILGKVMQSLVRNGVLDSVKGPNGGFFINQNTLGTLLIEILKTTDGNLVFDKCALGLKRCNPDHPCLLHPDFESCRNDLLKIFSKKTVLDLSKETEEKLIFIA